MRTILFKLAFYTLTPLWVISMLVTLPAPSYRPLYHGIRQWTAFVRWLMKKIARIEVEIRGLENLPAKGPYIVCPRHESTIDSFLALSIIPYPTALGKRELFYIPFLGFLLMKMKVLKIDRGKGTAHQQLPDIGNLIQKADRPILVYPEGTRVRSLQRIKLKSGAFHIQDGTDLKVITSATNAGYFWSAREFWMRPGKIILEYHSPMPHGLGKEAFQAELEHRVVRRSFELTKAAMAAAGEKIEEDPSTEPDDAPISG
jgi:1-acyl-sn-glycerol-3-phosphate acyltransferase